jgi:hypothetical protein
MTAVSQLSILRADTARLIDENPVEITVHRVTWVSDGAGGRVKSFDSDLPPVTVRLVASQRSVQQVEQSQSESGLTTVSAHALIAPHDADLRYGSDVEDAFALGGKAYKVARVVPRKWRGQVYSVHAVLEEVS